MSEQEMIARLEGKGYARTDIERAIGALFNCFGDLIVIGDADGVIREFLDDEVSR